MNDLSVIIILEETDCKICNIVCNELKRIKCYDKVNKILQDIKKLKKELQNENN